MLPNGLSANSIHVKDHDCMDHVEKLYYSCGYEPICVHCGEYLTENNDEDIYIYIYYLQCEECTEERILKR